MTPDAAPRRVRQGHHLRHQQRVRLRLPARQHGVVDRGARPARPQLRDRRRGRLDPHRRGPHAADHQRPGRPGRPSGTPSSPSWSQRLERGELERRRRLRGRREEAHRRRPRGAASRRSRTTSASRTSTSRSTPRSSATSTTRIKAKELFKRDKDYVVMNGEVLIVDEHTGRMLRRPPLQRGHAPGDRGQGGRGDQGREPDPRHDHPAELLPPLRQALRHDRHGA